MKSRNAFFITGNMTNSKHNNKIEGGAMQITFYKLSVDVYPFNPAGKHCATLISIVKV